MKRKTKLDFIKDDFEAILGLNAMKRFMSIKGRDFNLKFKNISAQLGQKWVQSNYTDLSYYSKDIYLFECCWTYLVSSSAAVSNSLKYFKENEISPQSSVLDVYAGAGLTSKDLLSYFDNVDNVNYCINQIKATNRLLKKNNLHIKNNYVDISEVPNKYDIVLCLETIEHFENPMPLTIDLVNLVNDNGYLIETTAFCSPHHYGHYPKYMINNEETTGRKASRKVHDYIREHFDMVFSGWNGLPRLWKKK